MRTEEEEEQVKVWLVAHDGAGWGGWAYRAVFVSYTIGAVAYRAVRTACRNIPRPVAAAQRAGAGGGGPGAGAGRGGWGGRRRRKDEGGGPLPRGGGRAGEGAGPCGGLARPTAGAPGLGPGAAASNEVVVHVQADKENARLVSAAS